MPFTWVQNISVGASADWADVQEMRTNVDWLDNNTAPCITHNAAVCPTNYSGNNGSYNGGDLGHFTAYAVNHNFAE
jgi:hypothetical protein